MAQKDRSDDDRAETAAPEQEVTASRFDFFGAATILRSLLLFNLLFAVQTILDMAYLWGNVTLPADISYASYAHRGAYPLIVTALLAAGFVLIAMKPGGAAERSKVIRPLVYLWVAQNVLLVASSILRLDLYVQIYLLTWWRIAAFVWMVLVAFGLILIVARIALNRSDEWLIRANLVTLTATLYVCSLDQFRRHHRRLQCQPQLGNFAQRCRGRHGLSDRPRTPGLAGHRQGARIARVVRSEPCFPPQLPSRTAAERHGFLACLGFSALAAPAHTRRQSEFDDRLTTTFLRRDV